MYRKFLEHAVIPAVSSAACYTTPHRYYEIANDGRRHYGLIYTTQGCEIYHFHDKDMPTPPGSVAFLPKNEIYTISLNGEVSTAFCIDFELLDSTDERPFCVTLPPQSPVPAIFAEAEKLWRRKTASHQPACMSCYYRIIAALMQQELNALHPRHEQKIAGAADYLHNHYTEQSFRVSVLPEMAGINPKYFNQLFREKYGAAPKEYVLNLKIERARELLDSEKMTVSQIAEQLGFGDVYHFSRVFSAMTGESPSQYRDRMK